MIAAIASLPLTASLARSIADPNPDTRLLMLVQACFDAGARCATADEVVNDADKAVIAGRGNPEMAALVERCSAAEEASDAAWLEMEQRLDAVADVAAHTLAGRVAKARCIMWCAGQRMLGEDGPAQRLVVSLMTDLLATEETTIVPAAASRAVHPDAELLELGERFDVAYADYQAERRAAGEQNRAWEEFEKTAPGSLRWSFAADCGMPLAMRERWAEGDLYNADEVQFIASQIAEYDRRGDQKFCSGVTGAEAAARGRQIVHAFKSWGPAAEEKREELLLDSQDDRLIHLLSRVEAVIAAIKRSEHLTLEGLAVKARALRVDIGWNHGGAHSDHADAVTGFALCDGILQLAESPQRAMA